MKPVVLIILDGWGIAQPGQGNAISRISTHSISSYWKMFPHTELLAAGSAVGLPEHEPGNSETGHMNIGAGRIVQQDVTRINRSIADGSFYKNQVFADAISYSQNHNSNIHIMGLLSDQCVHASTDHFIALLSLLDQHKFYSVYVHLFTDGRDSLPTSSLAINSVLENKYPVMKKFKIATVMGRYYAMDRDRRWERTERAYNALMGNAEFKAQSFQEAIANAYQRSETDEFIKTTAITYASGNQYPHIQDNDSVIFFNYRIDRTCQLTNMLMTRIPHLYFVTMTEYETGMNCHVAYPPQTIATTLGSVIESRGLRQLHAAESEKERFVTYYFNGLKEKPYKSEDRIIIPSPKVATYDLSPAMSAVELTDKVIEALNKNDYEFTVMNYANPDMVGHSGNIEATEKACETVDTQVGRIVESVLTLGGTCFITSDHGHAEEMLTPQQEMQTEHTSNPVLFICCRNSLNGHPRSGHPCALPSGVLGDIAPTILGLMNITIPKEMTGRNLLSGIV